MTQKILIIGDSAIFIELLKKTLRDFRPKDDELEILVATTEQGGITLVYENQDIKIILLDYAIEHEDSGKLIFDFIRKRLKNNSIQIIYLVGEIDNFDQREMANNVSSHFFINKNPWNSEKIKTEIVTALDIYDKLMFSAGANAALKEVEVLKTIDRKEMEYIMGKGKVISKVLDSIEKYAKEEDRKILLTGETGVGKEEVAKYLHNCSSRRNYKFVPVNCSSLTENIADSILFGVIGEYPGFHNKEPLIGKFEEAEGGTLFFDEIHALEERVQDKLLRVLQDKKFARLGEPAESRTANVRIICASNLVEESLGEFRVAFISRIVNKKIFIPPLRERYEDISHFINRFLSEENKKRNKNVSISNEAVDILLNNNWKLNVRGLMDTIISLVIEVEADKHSQKYIIQPELVKECLAEQFFGEEDDLSIDFSWKTANRIARKNAIIRALKAAGGKHEEAISKLGISRGTYFEWKKELKIE